MSIIILSKVNVFSIGKESEESTLISQNSEKNTCDAFFRLIRYLLLLEIASYSFEPNNVKYLVPS